MRSRSRFGRHVSSATATEFRHVKVIRKSIAKARTGAASRRRLGGTLSGLSACSRRNRALDGHLCSAVFSQQDETKGTTSQNLGFGFGKVQFFLFHQPNRVVVAFACLKLPVKDATPNQQEHDNGEDAPNHKIHRIVIIIRLDHGRWNGDGNKEGFRFGQGKGSITRPNLGLEYQGRGSGGSRHLDLDNHIARIIIEHGKGGSKGHGHIIGTTGIGQTRFNPYGTSQGHGSEFQHQFRFVIIVRIDG
mmetsp:Transcript_39924/g.83017  ORF Transcript_39924/g.83017 Transcript_39924/m.83017 type:complete len:247 (-) Transcript_39924:897-1637(-)